MIRKSTKFQLPCSPDEARGACLSAAERLDWPLKKQAPEQLRFRIPRARAGVITRLEVSIEAGGGGAEVDARARNMEDDILHEMKLRNCLDHFEEAVRAELAGSPPRPQPA